MGIPPQAVVTDDVPAFSLRLVKGAGDEVVHANRRFGSPCAFSSGSLLPFEDVPGIAAQFKVDPKAVDPLLRRPVVVAVVEQVIDAEVDQ